MSDDLIDAPELSPEERLKETRRANMAKARAARAARPNGPPVGSPEFNAVVEAKAAEVAARLFADLLARRGADTGSTDDRAWAQNLGSAIATSMAEVADQGTGRVRLSADETARRKAAHERMLDLLADARARGVRPVYQLIDKVELDIAENGRDVGRAIVEPIWVGTDRLHYPTEIEYDKAPNESMIPLDDAAKAIHAAYMESIGNPPARIEPLAVTHGGAVIRGGAATALFNSTAGRLGAAPQDAQASSGAATIRRHQPQMTRETRILGTLHAPVRENA